MFLIFYLIKKENGFYYQLIINIKNNIKNKRNYLNYYFNTYLYPISK